MVIDEIVWWSGVFYFTLWLLGKIKAHKGALCLFKFNFFILTNAKLSKETEYC